MVCCHGGQFLKASILLLPVVTSFPGANGELLWTGSLSKNSLVFSAFDIVLGTQKIRKVEGMNGDAIPPPASWMETFFVVA